MHSIGQGGENNTGGGYAYNNQNSIQERSQQVRENLWGQPLTLDKYVDINTNYIE